jgi:hypothetical protein
MDVSLRFWRFTVLFWSEWHWLWASSLLRRQKWIWCDAEEIVSLEYSDTENQIDRVNRTRINGMLTFVFFSFGTLQLYDMFELICDMPCHAEIPSLHVFLYFNLFAPIPVAKRSEARLRDCGFESRGRGCYCCVLSDRGLCDGPIPLTEESYWLWCVVSDVVTWRMRRPWPALGCSARGKGGGWGRCGTCS